MKKNMGGADKVIRLIVALIIVIAFFQGVISGTLGYVLLVVASIFTVTSLISFCPLYTIFGFNTCANKKQ